MEPEPELPIRVIRCVLCLSERELLVRRDLRLILRLSIVYNPYRKDSHRVSSKFWRAQYEA